MHMHVTKRRQVVNIPASHLGGPRFKPQPTDWLS
jgi:hypothetical protein